VHETVALPGAVTLLGVMAPQNKPLGMVSVSMTVPGKPFRGEMVIVELVDEPSFTAVGGDALIVKFWNRKIDAVEWVNEPLVPVRVRV